MSICPVLHQQGDNSPGIDHHKALHGLAVAFGLVTPCDLLGCHTHGQMWLVLLLGTGFGLPGPQLCRLKLAK